MGTTLSASIGLVAFIDVLARGMLSKLERLILDFYVDGHFASLLPGLIWVVWGGNDKKPIESSMLGRLNLDIWHLAFFNLLLYMCH